VPAPDELEEEELEDELEEEEELLEELLLLELDEEDDDDDDDEALQELVWSQLGKLAAAPKLLPRLPVRPPSVGFCAAPLEVAPAALAWLLACAMRSSKLGIAGALCANTLPENNITLHKVTKNRFIKRQKCKIN
jgi:hypothetical protein